MDEWLSLAATVISRFSQNTAVITVPKPADCQFRHLEMVSIQDSMVLMVVVLRGARIKQQLLTFENPVSQDELTAISDKMNQTYAGLTGSEIQAKGIKSTPLGAKMTDNLAKIMQTEDEQEYNQSYLEGLHFMLNQPEFSHNQRILAIMEILEAQSHAGHNSSAEEKWQAGTGGDRQRKQSRSRPGLQPGHQSLWTTERSQRDYRGSGTYVVWLSQGNFRRQLYILNIKRSEAELYGVNTFIKNDRDNTN